MGKTESTEIVVEAAAPSAEAYDPWKDMRSILLPRAGGNEQQSQFCAKIGRAHV